MYEKISSALGSKVCVKTRRMEKAGGRSEGGGITEKRVRKGKSKTEPWSAAAG
jgi:hypothetical protein